MGLNSAQLSIILQHKNSNSLDYRALIDEVNQSLSQQFAAGTGSAQADLVYGPVKRTLAGGASESLDLAGGGLVDAFGNALNFAKVRAIVIQNLSGAKILTVGNDANPLVFLGAGANTAVLAPTAKLAMDNPVTGWPVTPGTGDKLKVANNAGDPCDYLIWIVGTSA
ncbi:MAG: hypothetical protein NTY36_01255 [Deltaproteobacteria bacterium]|nr:hypothetical protein [Deltaproteobacteria bacterium]